MNQKRRNQLKIILNRLEDVQSDVIKIREEEEHYRDNIPVDLQESARYEQSDAMCDDLLDALDGLADAVSSIVSAIAE